jgi:hypothetical protein
MEKTVYLFPQKGLVVSKGNLHKHHGEYVTLDNSPINEIKIISIGSKRIKISYTVSGKEVTAYTRTNINDFITGCVIDDKVIYGPFIWARISIGLELVKVGSDRYKKALEVYQYETDKGIPVKDWIIGGIYKNNSQKLRYLGVCSYWDTYRSYNHKTHKYDAIIKECKKHMWEYIGTVNWLHRYNRPKVTELLEVSKDSIVDVLKGYRSSYNGKSTEYRHSLKRYTIRPVGYSLVGEPIMEYLNKFKDGKATF